MGHPICRFSAKEAYVGHQPDEYGELFELDFWKVDFSPLRRYPQPQDLRFAS